MVFRLAFPSGIHVWQLHAAVLLRSLRVGASFQCLYNWEVIDGHVLCFVGASQNDHHPLPNIPELGYYLLVFPAVFQCKPRFSLLTDCLKRKAESLVSPQTAAPFEVLLGP